jgi:hypothetical protein
MVTGQKRRKLHEVLLRRISGSRRQWTSDSGYGTERCKGNRSAQHGPARDLTGESGVQKIIDWHYWSPAGVLNAMGK